MGLGLWFAQGSPEAAGTTRPDRLKLQSLLIQKVICVRRTFSWPQGSSEKLLTLKILSGNEVLLNVCHLMSSEEEEES